MRHPHRSAWSLIELLICVAIVAVLAALLLPVLSSVREGARSVRCMGNMRQLGMAFQNYMAENRGWLPPGFDGAGPQTWGMGHWAGYLREMLETGRSINGSNREDTMVLLTGVLHCDNALTKPADIIASADGSAADMWRTRALVAHSYGNTKLLKDNWDPGHRGTNSRKIQEMGGTILLYENVGAGINGDYPVSPVAQMAIDTQRRRVVSWAGSGVGSFPVGHRPTFWWREGASSVIQDYASENIDYCSMRVSHRGKTTLLYADAHVELTRPYDPYIRLRDNGRLGSAYDVGNLWHGGTLYTPSDINTVWRDNAWWCR